MATAASGHDDGDGGEGDEREGRELAGVRVRMGMRMSVPKCASIVNGDAACDRHAKTM